MMIYEMHFNFFQDFTDLEGDLSASDLRADEFSAMDYYRAGLSPPRNLATDLMNDNIKLTPRNEIKFTPREGDRGLDVQTPMFETIHINSPRINELVTDPSIQTQTGNHG